MSWSPNEILKEVKDLRNTLVSNPKLYAEKILKETAVTASITMPMQQISKDGQTLDSQTVTIPFYMRNNFSLGSISNTWNDLVDMSWANTFAKFLNNVSTFGGSPQISMQSEAMSTKSWQGSKFDGFSVNCLFLCTSRRINPTKIIRTLAASALPTRLADQKFGNLEAYTNFKKSFSNAIGEIGGLISNAFDSQDAKDKVDSGVTYIQNGIDSVGMVAPLYYGIDGTMSDGFKPIKNTTLTLQVGDYFKATELLVQNISNITFSKEIIAPNTFNNKRAGDLYDPTVPDGYEDVYGFPLYAECSISFIPCSMMTKEKFESYFIDKHAEPSSGGVFGSIKEAFNSYASLGRIF